MFIIALFITLGLLVVINFYLHRKRKPTLGMVILGILGSIFSYPLTEPLHSIVPLLTILLVLALNRNWGVTVYRFASIAVFTFCWGAMVDHELQEIERLSEKYPYESMASRLPTRMEKTTGESHYDPHQLELQESFFDQNTDPNRTRVLKSIHEDHVNRFIISPNFGRLRTIRSESRLLKYGDYFLLPDPNREGKPGDRRFYDCSSSQTAEEVHDPDLEMLNRKSIFGFAFPVGFGLIRSRDEVAGFLPHQMREAPGPTKLWAIRTIDLVGLLHDKPIVYDSDLLPKMDGPIDERHMDERRVEENKMYPKKIRNLDSFEAQALEQLKAGADISIEPLGLDLRMLGAIRSLKQCIVCHEGSRGDLLGAFTYHLEPVAK